MGVGNRDAAPFPPDAAAGDGTIGCVERAGPVAVAGESSGGSEAGVGPGKADAVVKACSDSGIVEAVI